MQMFVPWMKMIVTMNVKGCVLCNFEPTNGKLGLYSLVPNPSLPWDNLSMYFVRGLSMSKRGHEVDRFICKMIPCNKQAIAE